MRHLRIATYNVHKCQGMDGRVRPERIAEVIREFAPDVLALQEVLSIDDGRREMNQARYLAESLGMALAFGQTRELNGGAYGNVLLSKLPVRSFCHYDLSVPGRENRGCLRTDVHLPDNTVLHVFNLHLGTAFMERRRQAKMLLEQELIRSRDLDGARIVLGDFNEWLPGLVSRVLAAEFQSADIRTLLKYKRTYPGVFPLMHLDHIYYDAALRPVKVLLHRTMKALLASDHLPLVADFAVNSETQPASHSLSDPAA